jgi:hypothetical protein
MGTDNGNGDYHCHFKKQPETTEEIERAIMACRVSCTQAVRYSGSDPAILNRLRELNSAESSDVLNPPQVAKVGFFTKLWHRLRKKTQ